MENFPDLSAWELVLRIAAAAALGGLVGFEREFSDQPAGFRTHILVSLGAALFTLVGAYGVEVFLRDGGGGVTFDPTRIAAQVVTGIGFLGAGAILRQGVNVRGLTTAAALWVTAAIGTAVGLGYYVGAVLVAVVTVVSLYGLKRFERFVFPRLRRGYFRFTIEMDQELRLSDLATVLEEIGGRIDALKIVTDEEGSRHLATRVFLPPDVEVSDVAQRMSEVRGVTEIHWN